jgi:predicted dehydrogenase
LRAGVERRPLPDAVPVPTFADGVASMRVLDAIRESADSGWPVAIPTWRAAKRRYQAEP